MSKTLAIIACFLGLFAVTSAQTEELPFCQITFRKLSPAYDCSEVEKDENGSLEEVCIPLDSEAAEIYLNAEYASHHEINFDLSYIRLNGDCDCVLTLYKNNAAHGCHVRRTLRTNGGETEIWPVDFLKEKSYSFRVKCDFVDL